MGDYILEASAPTLVGRLTLGSRAGYEDGKEFSLTDLEDFLHNVNDVFGKSNLWIPIPSIINEGKLVVKTGDSRYGEKVYRLDFALSPRAEPISRNSFYETLCEYGFVLGRILKQQRVYVDFEGTTYVFKITDEVGIANEDEIRSKAEQYLTKGRPNWDVPHTLETVRWMQELVNAEGGNRQVLVSAMYLHDIGWGGMFDNQQCNYDTVSAGKKLQAQQSVERAREILTDLRRPSSEIGHILSLIGVHDDLDQVETPYEILVLEADTLGQLSTPQNGNFGTLDYSRFIDHVREERAPKFRTATGIRRMDELLAGK